MTNNTTTADAQAELIEANDRIARDLIPAMVWLGVLMLVGIVGNLLVCFVFFFRLRMTTQDRLIIALAVFDLLSCFIAMPTEIVDMRYFLMFDNEFACRLLRFIIHYCTFASILTLIVIAVDRYMKVCYPLRRQMSLKHVKMALLCVLLVALLFAFPATILYGTRTTEVEGVSLNGHDCSTSDSVTGTSYPLVYNSFLFLAFVLVFVTLTVIYVRIWREMKRHRLYMARNSIPGGSKVYLPTASEISSSCERPPVWGRRRRPSALADEYSNNNEDDVFVESRSKQARGSGVGTGEESAARRRSACSGGGAEFCQHPSVQSDTTLCEAELGTRQIEDVVVDKNTVLVIEGESRVSDDVKCAGQDVDVSSSVCDPQRKTSNGALPASVLKSEKPVRASGETDEKNTSMMIQTCPPVSESAASVDDDDEFVKENNDVSDPGLKNATSDETDGGKQSRIEDGTDCSLKPASATTLGNDRRRHHSDTTSQNERTDIPDVDGDAAVELVKCTCDTNTGALADQVSEDPTDKERTQVLHSCSRCSDGGILPKTFSTEKNDSEDVSATPASQLQSDVTPTSADAVKSGQSEHEASRPSLTTQTDPATAGNALSTAQDDAVVIRRKVVKSKSVSEPRNHKATVIALSVTVVFFLSIVPHLSLITARTINKDFDRDLRGAALVFYNIFLRSYFINSVSNPAIYGVLNARFRSECLQLFRQLLCCRKRLS